MHGSGHGDGGFKIFLWSCIYWLWHGGIWIIGEVIKHPGNTDGLLR